MTFLDSVLTRVPTQEISRRAREVHFWRALATLLAGLLFGLGWLTAKAFGVVWLVLVWSAVAVRMGWQEARKPSATADR